MSTSPPDLSIVKNMQAWRRRRFLVNGNALLLSGASYDALTGQVDFSRPGNLSAAVAGLRLGSIEWGKKHAACRGLRRLID